MQCWGLDQGPCVCWISLLPTKVPFPFFFFSIWDKAFVDLKLSIGFTDIHQHALLSFQFETGFLLFPLHLLPLPAPHSFRFSATGAYPHSFLLTVLHSFPASNSACDWASFSPSTCKLVLLWCSDFMVWEFPTLFTCLCFKLMLSKQAIFLYLVFGGSALLWSWRRGPWCPLMQFSFLSLMTRHWKSSCSLLMCVCLSWEGRHFYHLCPVERWARWTSSCIPRCLERYVPIQVGSGGQGIETRFQPDAQVSASASAPVIVCPFMIVSAFTPFFSRTFSCSLFPFESMTFSFWRTNNLILRKKKLVSRDEAGKWFKLGDFWFHVPFWVGWVVFPSSSLRLFCLTL